MIVVLTERGSAGGAAGTGGYNANDKMKIAQCYGLEQWCRMAGRGRMFWPRLARLTPACKHSLKILAVLVLLLLALRMSNQAEVFRRRAQTVAVGADPDPVGADPDPVVRERRQVVREMMQVTIHETQHA